MKNRFKKGFLLFILLLVFSCKENRKSTAEPQDAQEEIRNTGEQKNQKLSDLIRVYAPRKNSEINSPMVIEGEARGFWFFEGSAPIEIISGTGKTLSRGIIEAKGNWMTEDFVLFAGKIEFKTSGEEGYLVFRRSNPSGLPENDVTYEIPIQFGQK